MKYALTVLTSIGIFFGCAVDSAPTTLSDTKISITDNAFHYHGEINSEANARVFQLAERATVIPSLLVITSGGGDVLAGLELGRWVFRNQLDVQVTQYCASSCANYVFTAGNRKLLDSKAAIIWHGGALQEEWNVGCDALADISTPDECDENRIRELQAAQLAEWKTEEAQFFALVGVDQRITVLGQDPSYDCRQGNDYIGWYYSLKAMEQMGVRKVVLPEGRWRPRSPDRRQKICEVNLRTE